MAPWCCSKRHDMVAIANDMSTVNETPTKGGGQSVPPLCERAPLATAEQPEGLPEGSRGSQRSEAPRLAAPFEQHPEGVPESFVRSGVSFLHPSGVRSVFVSVPGVSSRSALLNPRLPSCTALRCFPFQQANKLETRLSKECVQIVPTLSAPPRIRVHPCPSVVKNL